MIELTYEKLTSKGLESAYVTKQLRAFNSKIVGEYPDPAPIGFVVREKGSDRIIAGTFGWLKWGQLYLDLAWVDEEYRNHGIGGVLLKKMEEAAIENGMPRIRTETGSFQALPFYLKHGFEAYAENEVFSVDGQRHTEYLLRKQLVLLGNS